MSFSYCTPVLSLEDFPLLKLSGGRGPGKSSKDDTMTRTAKAKAKKVLKLEALRLEEARVQKEKEELMERKKKEKDTRVKRREEMKLKAIAKKEAEKKAIDERTSGLEKMKKEKAEKRKELMEKRLAERTKKIELGGRKRKSADEQKDRAEKVEVEKVTRVLKRKKTDGSGDDDCDGEKRVCRTGQKEYAFRPDSEERMVFENRSFASPEACLPKDGPDGSDVQPKDVSLSTVNALRPVRAAARRQLKISEKAHTPEIARPRTTRFCRRVAVMQVERLERSGTKLKRKMQAGPMFGDEEHVPLKKPGTTTGLARRVSQAKIKKLLGPVRKSLEMPVEVASSGCSATCSEDGCSETCQCRVNDIECFTEAGCLCNENNCTNDRRAEIYDNEMHKELVRQANANMSVISERFDDTLLSVDPVSPVSIVANSSEKYVFPKSPKIVSPPPKRPMSNPPNQVQNVVPAAVPPQRSQASSGIDLSAEMCSASLSAFLPFVLDPDNFRSVQNSSKVKLLTGEAVFFGLIKEATRANALGGCISVMHPDSYFKWRSGHHLDRNQLMESVYFREEVETLLIPLHTGTVQNGHWSLAAMFVREGKVTVYDSVNTTKDTQKERLGWLKGMLEVMFPRDEFSEIRMRYAYPHQRNTQNDNSNCGMHVILNARKVAEGRRNLASKVGEKVNMREERSTLYKSLIAAGREYANVAHDPNRRALTPSFLAPPVALNKNRRR